MTESMSPEQALEINRLLAREFIISHLDIEPTHENVEALATFIQQLEQKTY